MILSFHADPVTGRKEVVKKKILVVDDDANVRGYLISLFEDNGYEVHAAEDTAQGFEKVKTVLPDVITLDIEMPGEWGPRFYQKLTMDDSLKNIPVIIISGLEGHQCAVKNAAATISKPFDPDRLIKIVTKVLS